MSLVDEIEKITMSTMNFMYAAVLTSVKQRNTIEINANRSGVTRVLNKCGNPHYQGATMNGNDSVGTCDIPDQTPIPGLH